MIRIRTLFTPLVLMSLPTPGATQGVWAKVPPLPTACYTWDETFNDDNLRAQSELELAIGKQETINRSLSARLTAATTGTAHQDTQARIVEQRKALEQKLRAVKERYVADAEPLTPVYKTYQEATDQGAGATRRAKLPEFAAAYDAAYERFCAKWWAATSPFVTYLGELKRLLIETAIPYGDQLARSQKARLEGMSIPSATYKSTAEMKAVKEYLEVARTIYQQRPTRRLKAM